MIPRTNRTADAARARLKGLGMADIFPAMSRVIPSGEGKTHIPD
jgi:hypothetical protein